MIVAGAREQHLLHETDHPVHFTRHGLPLKRGMGAFIVTAPLFPLPMDHCPVFSGAFTVCQMQWL